MSTPPTDATAPADDLALEDFLPYRLSVLTNTISNALASVYSRQFELSIPAWRVMAILGRFDNLSAAELVDKTAMDKVAISRAVSLLQDKQYLTRREDTEDRRRSVLSLSNKGRDTYAQIVPLAQRYEQDLLQNLNPEEVDQLHSLIDRLMQKATQWKEHGLDGP